VGDLGEEDTKIHDDGEGRSAKVEYQQGTPLLTDGRRREERLKTY
jgi:hypothetical protein